MKSPTCSYCKCDAKLVDSAEIYGKSYGLIWLCAPCDAYVGIHKNSHNARPLGTLANGSLRKLRSAAHEAFDPMWRRAVQVHQISRYKARNEAYAWLAAQLNLDQDNCHIAMFDEEACKRVISLFSK